MKVATMGKWLTADWFRRFLAGFAVGLVATLALSSGGVRAGTGAPSPAMEQGETFGRMQLSAGPASAEKPADPATA